VTRTCVGCRALGSAEELVRVVVTDTGEVAFDLAGGAFGRGAWVHPRSACLANAARSGLARAFRRELRVSPEALVRALHRAAERRAAGLLMAARRARKLEAGSTAVQHAVSDRRAELVIVARDARAAAEHAFLSPLIASGRAVAHGTKGELGAYIGRPDTALVAVTDARIARALKTAIEWTMVPEPNAVSVGARRTIVSEAG